MKRLAVTLAVLSLFALVPAAAHADFHPACSPPSAGAADVDLALGELPTEFVYSGTVHCHDATITIHSVTLRKVNGAQLGPAVSASCTTNATDECTASGTVSNIGQTGKFEVRMLFSVDGFANRSRVGTYKFTAVLPPKRK